MEHALEELRRGARPVEVWERYRGQVAGLHLEAVVILWLRVRPSLRAGRRPEAQLCLIPRKRAA